MRIIALSICISLTFALSGCALNAALEASEEADRQHAYQLHMAALEGQCRSYGFTPPSEGFSNCMMQSDQAMQQRAATIDAAILSQPSPPQQQIVPPNLPQTHRTNCRSDSFGNTNCVTRPAFQTPVFENPNFR